MKKSLLTICTALLLFGGTTGIFAYANNFEFDLNPIEPTKNTEEKLDIEYQEEVDLDDEEVGSGQFNPVDIADDDEESDLDDDEESDLND